jgi:hypothetical protein
VQTTITTTLTTRIDIFDKSIDINVAAEDDGLPRDAIMAVVEGSAKALLLQINREKYAPLLGEVDE